MEIEIASQKDAVEWDRIIDESPHGTIFHTWKWLKIVERHTASKLFPVVINEDKLPVGIIPLFFLKRFGVRCIFSPPPKTALYYLGPILIDYEKKRQNRKERDFLEFQRMVDSIILEDLKANYISISLPPGLSDPRPYKWAGYTIYPAYDYVLNLARGVDHQWQQIPRKVRQNINRTSSRGIKVTEGNRNDFIKIIDLMNRRYSEQGRLGKVSKAYLLDIFDTYKGSIKVFTANYNGEIVTGVVDLVHKDQLLSWIGNPKPGIPILPSPNEGIIWEEIKYACNQGLNHYITMSAAGNERLHSYYSSKINSILAIRYTAKKHSWIAGKMEHFYSGILKPLEEKMHTFDL